MLYSVARPDSVTSLRCTTVPGISPRLPHKKTNEKKTKSEPTKHRSSRRTGSCASPHRLEEEGGGDGSNNTLPAEEETPADICPTNLALAHIGDLNGSDKNDEDENDSSDWSTDSNEEVRELGVLSRRGDQTLSQPVPSGGGRVSGIRLRPA